MKFEVKSRWNGSVLFSLETESLKLCVEAAVKSGANLAGANLADAYLAGANLADANLAGANLAGANLADAYLAGANLAGAYLAGANLAGANLADAYLAGANLADAYLADAYLAGANLAGAYLADAYLAGANLAGANLAGANLAGAKGIEKFPIQIMGHKHYIRTTQEGKLRIGCEEHSFEEWREIAEKLGGENGYSDLDVEIYRKHIQHIEEVSKLLWATKKVGA